MENLQSLMSCLDEISSQIPDGIYLKMADQMKRVHDHMNGNKPIHEDTFYYSDDDSVLESDNDSDSDFEASPPRRVLITPIRNQLLDYVKKMHQEYKVLMKWEKEATKTVQIKRMTAQHKSGAIKAWCEVQFDFGEVLPNVELLNGTPSTRQFSLVVYPVLVRLRMEDGLGKTWWKTVFGQLCWKLEPRRRLSVLNVDSSTMMIFHSKRFKNFPRLRKRFTLTTRKLRTNTYWVS